jgi:hypothetical protein
MNTFKLTNYTNNYLLILNLEDIWAAAYKWYINTQGAYTVIGNNERVLLSNLIYFNTNGPRISTKSPSGAITFADGNLYNYQRTNLILVNYSNEQQSHKANYKSGYRGVTWDQQKSKWCAQLSKGGIRVHRSHHITELEAALAYNAAQLTYNGPGAFQNLITINSP